VHEAARYRRCSGLSPRQALELLAAACERHDPDRLGAVRVRVEPGPRVTLLVPTPELGAEAGRDRTEHAALGALVQGYADVTGEYPQPQPAPATPDTALSEGLVRLLLAGDSPSRAYHDPGEWLLVAAGVSAERARAIFESVRRDDTGEYGAAAEEADGRSVHLFHVRHDSGRRSSFLAPVRAGYFDDCAVLVAFPGDGGTLFLPPENAPGLPELRAFTRLLRRAPSVVGATLPYPEHAGAPLLAALFPRPPGVDGAGWVLMPLAGLRFRDRVQLEPPAAARAAVEVVDLRDSAAALDRLAAAIERARPRAGYRLALRRTRHAERPPDQELERLEAQRLALDLQVHAARALQPNQPRLYRFDQTQLGGLAEVLRGYPQRVVRDGEIRYTFQAAHGARRGRAVERAGVHYLYLDPERVGAALGPSPRVFWDALAERTTRFWLDPYWSRYYGGRNDGQVFVPHGLALFPPMHDWDDDGMDDHLRRLLGRSLPVGAGAPLPARPIYVFDGPPVPDGEIRVSVLDRDAFVPLRTRIGWVNANLELMRPDRRAADVIAALSDAHAREALVAEAERRTAALEREFGEAALRVSQRVSALLDDLMGVLTDEIDGLLGTAAASLVRIPALKARLAALAEAEGEMRALDEEVRSALGEGEHDVAALADRYRSLLEEALSQIAKAEATSRTIEGRIDAELRRLGATRHRLRRRLEER
jgi:hypothetical protein